MRELTAEELEAVAAKARKLAQGDPSLERSWQFYLLFNEKHGAFGWRRGNRRKLTRRGWKEQLIHIEDKRFELVPITLNQSQRNLEALKLREERKGNPVRIVIVKVRQNGISTDILGDCAWLMLTRTNKSLRIVADRGDLCHLFLNRLRVMFRNLRRPDGTPWNLEFKNSNRDEISLGEPFHSSIRVVSANTPSAGFGETAALVDMEETSKWIDAVETAKGVLMTLPALNGTYAFDVSQPKGNTGYFAEKFQRAWNKKQGLSLSEIDPELDRVLDIGRWQPIFFPWFIHDEYRWTQLGEGREKSLPENVRAAIEKTLDEEERTLLKQSYFMRGRGLCHVDYDQLAWRRYYIDTQCNGSVEVFHQQCPAFPEEAFLASGRAAFNTAHVQRMMSEHRSEPSFVGDIIEVEDKAA